MIFRSLPSLSYDDNGIFEKVDDFTTPQFSQTLLIYSPSTHKGVQVYIKQLTELYPDIDVQGAVSSSDVNSIMEENIFTTWAAIEFTLSEEQIASG